jgi:hypothetical protein
LECRSSLTPAGHSLSKSHDESRFYQRWANLLLTAATHADRGPEGRRGERLSAALPALRSPAKQKPWRRWR